MSEANVESVRSVYRAVNEDDLPAFLALMHPEVELTTSGVYPDFQPTYRGHEGAVDYWRAAREVWEAFAIEIRRCESIGEHVVALVHQEVKGREGISVEHDWGHLFSFADGLVWRVTAYVTFPAAMEAAAHTTEAQRG